MMEHDVVTKAEVKVSFRAPRSGGANDILYFLFGDADLASILVLAFAIVFFGAAPVLLLLLFGYYSGGMRWLIALGLTTASGLVLLYLLKRGVRAVAEEGGQPPAAEEFRGELTRLREAVQRAADGYAYSQMQVRGRVCDIMLDKLSSMRGLGRERMREMLDDGQADFVGEPVLADFLLKYHRGTQDWDRLKRQGGRSRERGARFVSELEYVLDRMEAWT